MGKIAELIRSTPCTATATFPVRLTKRAVESLIRDHDGSERFAWDADLKGFGVRLMGSGVLTYVVQYRDNGGRTRRIAVGRHGVLTAEGARAQAVQLLAAVARGDNPSLARKEARSKAKRTATIAQLSERFIREYLEPKRKARTVESYRRLLRLRVLPVLGNAAVDAVTRDDIEALHLRLRHTPYEANRTLAVLSKMFNLAEAWRLRPLQSNPCYRLERYTEHKRDRFFNDNELGRIGSAIAELEANQMLSDGATLAIRLLALTGCRASEILALRWSAVDLENGTLCLADAKAGARTVPLGAPAIALLRARPRASDRVIGGRVPGTVLTLSGLEKAWARVRCAAGLENARLHDLRHTVGTYAGQAGLNAFTVRDILGHKTLAMTDRYVSRDTSPLRHAADQVAGRVAAALAGKHGQRRRSKPRASHVDKRR